MNKGFTTTDTQTLRGNYQIPPRPRKPQRQEFTSPYIQRTNKFIGKRNKKPFQWNSI